MEDKYTETWRRHFYSGEAWQRKRRYILKRDSYLCRICARYGRRKEAVEVHHIKHLEDAPELALDNTNLISVCRKCHNDLHPEKRKSGGGAGFRKDIY